MDTNNNNVRKIGRIKYITQRIRNGKIQRRKKISAIKGYIIRNNKLTRMTSTEKRNRRMGARRAKIKRRMKFRQILRKRNISLRKRRSLGLH